MFSNHKSNEGEVLRYYLVLLQSYLESTSNINKKFINSWNDDIKPLLRKKYPPIMDGIFSVNYDIEIYMQDIDKEIENVLNRKKMAEFRLDSPEKKIRKSNTKYNFHRKKQLDFEEESRESIKFKAALKKYKKVVSFFDYNKNIDNIISDNNNIRTKKKSLKRNSSVIQLRYHSTTVINKPINNLFYKKHKKFQSTEFNPKVELNKKDEIKLEYKEMTSDFNEEEEEEDKNIFYHAEKTKLKYLSVNLMLQKITLNDFIKNNLIQLYQFCQQCFSFLNSEIFFTKIINCYKYYKDKNTPLEKLSNLFEFINILIIEMIHYYGCIPNNNSSKIIKNFYNELLVSFQKYTTNISDITNSIQSVLFLFEIPKPIYNDLLETQRYIQFYKDLKLSQKKNRLNFYFKKESEEFLNNTVINTKMKIPRNIKTNYFSILNYQTKDIAEKLISISRTLINKIERRELYKAVYMKKDKYNNSPNVMKNIEQFNNLTYFIIEDILCYDFPKTRAKIIEKWIDVALYCIKNYDFNDYLAINVALNNYIITGLQLTFKEISKNYVSKLMKMNNLCNVQGNYLEIRKIMKKIPKKAFYIPYLGILLKDLGFLEEKYKYMVGDAMVNFDKIEIVQNTIDDFFSFKKNAHDSLKDPNKNLFFFENIITRSEDELEKLAEKLEPKFILFDKMKNVKRLSMVDKKYFVENSKRSAVIGDDIINALRAQYNTVK